MPKYKRGLFIFHRDLRIVDNVGLNAAIRDCEEVFTAFIFTPEQVGKQNHYKSTNAVSFMIESLVDLQEQLPGIMFLYGEPIRMTGQLIRSLNIDCVFFNRDYTPYAVKRDKNTADLCHKMGVNCSMLSDYYLYEPGSIVHGANRALYHKFTPFYEAALKMDVLAPQTRHAKQALHRNILPEHRITLDDAFSRFTHHNPNIAVLGGREMGRKCLSRALAEQKDYEKNRDTMAYKTSMLSAYLKFGCVSIREAFHAFKHRFGLHHEIIRQIIWREFFAHLLYGYPDILKEGTYYPNYGKIRWRTNKRALDAWKQGKTGVPIVDACMRQLNETGYMHNRGRMLVATFLIKTLLLDWREGERYFAQKLTDYDIASNNGNWMSIMGGGAYTTPYFRVMNPWIQSAKFDKDGVYIKQWVKELSAVEPKDIHRWADAYKKYKDINYPKPIADYYEEKEVFLKLYREFV